MKIKKFAPKFNLSTIILTSILTSAFFNQNSHGWNHIKEILYPTTGMFSMFFTDYLQITSNQICPFFKKLSNSTRDFPQTTPNLNGINLNTSIICKYDNLKAADEKQLMETEPIPLLLIKTTRSLIKAGVWNFFYIASKTLNTLFFEASEENEKMNFEGCSVGRNSYMLGKFFIKDIKDLYEIYNQENLQEINFLNPDEKSIILAISATSGFLIGNFCTVRSRHIKSVLVNKFFKKSLSPLISPAVSTFIPMYIFWAIFTPARKLTKYFFFLVIIPALTSEYLGFELNPTEYKLCNKLYKIGFEASYVFLWIIPQMYHYFINARKNRAYAIT